MLTRNGGTDLLPVLGRKCALLVREDGYFEIWFYPFKALYDGKILFKKNNDVVPISSISRQILQTPYISSIVLQGNVRGRIDFLCSPSNPVCLIQFHIQPDTAEKIILRFKPAVQLMWPASTDGEVKITKKLDGRLVFARRTGKRVLYFLIASERDFIFSQDELELDTKGGEVSLAFSGLVDDFIESEKLISQYLGNYPKLLEENEEYYKRICEETVELRSDNSVMDEAFTWAKVGLEKCFVETAFGKGLVAGYALAMNGNRPGFAWFFGRDSAWMGFALLCIGDFEKVRDNLLLEKKFQIKEGENKGKIYHEVSLAHDFVPDPSYAYPAGDSTPLYVILASEYVKWSGDIGFLKENWQSLKDAMDWCERMDVDGDFLIDNPPAGHQWFDYGEKNMIDLVAIWARALKEGSWLASVMGDEELKKKWLDKAQKVRDILNNDFWNKKRGYFYDRKLPDGSFLNLMTCNPLIPLLWQQIEEEKAQRSLSLVSSQLFSTDWGVRTTAKSEQIYNPWGYHEGTVWPLVTGWASWAHFLNCRPSDGYAELLKNIKLTYDFSLGYIPEILNGDKYEAGGCPLQGWSEAMVILPIVKGMLGLQPNAIERKLEAQIHIPEEIGYLRLSNIKIGDSTWEMEWRGFAKKKILKIKKNDGGVYSLNLKICMAGQSEAWAIVNGRKLKPVFERKPCGYHAIFNFNISSEAIIEIYF